MMRLDRCSCIGVLKQDYCGLDECEGRRLATIFPPKCLMGEKTKIKVWWGREHLGVCIAYILQDHVHYIIIEKNASFSRKLNSPHTT